MSRRTRHRDWLAGERQLDRRTTASIDRDRVALAERRVFRCAKCHDVMPAGDVALLCPTCLRPSTP